MEHKNHAKKNHAFKITKGHLESLLHRSVAAMVYRCCSELVRCRGASEKLFEHRLRKTKIKPSKSQSSLHLLPSGWLESRLLDSVAGSGVSARQVVCCFWLCTGACLVTGWCSPMDF